jgi:hypothetical protein
VSGRGAARGAAGIEPAIARVPPHARGHVRRPPWSAPALRFAHRAAASTSTAAKRRVGVALHPLCGFRPSVTVACAPSRGAAWPPARRNRRLAPRSRGVEPPAARTDRCAPLLWTPRCRRRAFRRRGDLEPSRFQIPLLPQGVGHFGSTNRNPSREQMVRTVVAGPSSAVIHRAVDTPQTPVSTAS